MAGTVLNEKFDTLEQAQARAAELQQVPFYREGNTPILAWFMDGGKQYASRYPGKDITGKHFEAGTMIWRKARKNLVA